MARDGLSVLRCARIWSISLILNLIATPLTTANPSEDFPDSVLPSVYRALREGRNYLKQQNYSAAVTALEKELPRINGNRAYLSLLRDAYSGYVRELLESGREEEARPYLRSLRILDAEAAAALAQIRPLRPVTKTSAPASDSASTDRSSMVVRAQMDDSNRSESPRSPTAEELVRRAEHAYNNRDYKKAERLYEQAQQLNASSMTASRERWGYCKLFCVMQQLEQAENDPQAAVRLERETRAALAMSSKLDVFGQQVLMRLQQQQRKQNADNLGPVHHLSQELSGWSVAETSNFRILHHQSRELVEQVAHIAESTRDTVYRQWFGKNGSSWKPRCDIYLHATADAYSRATKKPVNWPGHSTIEHHESAAIIRRIDLRCDEVNMLTAVLPHETTHAVLAGNFGDQPVSRWVDEGIALLSEPQEKIDRYLRSLDLYRQQGQLYSCRELMLLKDYPAESERWAAFYVQSLSLVDFLVNQKDAPTFVQFVKDGMRQGYETALLRHYRWSLNDLEQHWRSHIASKASQNSLSGRGQ